MKTEFTFQELTVRMAAAILSRANPPDNRKTIVCEAMLMARELNDAFRNSGDSSRVVVETDRDEGIA